MLLPLLVAGAFGSLLAIITIAGESSTPFRHRLFAMVLPATIIAWVVAAAIGMVAAWFLAFEQTLDPSRDSRLRRYLYLFCLLLGEIAGVAWLLVMSGQQGTSDAASWLVWLVLLAGPLIVGLHHSVRLLCKSGCPQKEFEPDAQQPS